MKSQKTEEPEIIRALQKRPLERQPAQSAQAEGHWRLGIYKHQRVISFGYRGDITDNFWISPRNDKL